MKCGFCGHIINSCKIAVPSPYHTSMWHYAAPCLQLCLLKISKVISNVALSQKVTFIYISYAYCRPESKPGTEWSIFGLQPGDCPWFVGFTTATALLVKFVTAFFDVSALFESLQDKSLAEVGSRSDVTRLLLFSTLEELE